MWVFIMPTYLGKGQGFAEMGARWTPYMCDLQDYVEKNVKNVIMIA